MVWVSFQPTFYSGAVIDLSKRVRKGRTDTGAVIDLSKRVKKGRTDTDAVIDLSKRVRKGRTECGLGLIVKESKKGEN